MLVRRVGDRLAVRRRARGHHPGAAAAGPRHRSRRGARRRDRARRRPASPRCGPIRKEESARLLEPWLGSGLALDDLPVPRMIVVKLAVRRRSISRRCARRWPSRSPARASTIIAAGSTACAPWRGPTIAGGIGVLVADAGGDGAVGDLRDARRDGDQPPDRRGAALHRRHDGFIAGQFQRHFLMLGLEGGLIGGGACDAAVRRWPASPRAWAPARRAATRSPTLFGSFSLGWGGYLAIVAQIVLVAAGDGGRVAADRQPHAGNGRVAPCHPTRRILRYHPAGDRN